MSFGNAISTVTLVFVSCIAGITGTVGSYAEPAVDSFADVAHMRELELAIRSNNPEWYYAGMQLSAFNHNGKYWEKRTISWAVMDDSSRLPKKFVEAVMEEAFAKYAAVIPINFVKITRRWRPDIRVRLVFIQTSEKTPLCSVRYPLSEKLDYEGIDITFDDQRNWTDDVDNPKSWRNLRYLALFEIGRALGLTWSDCPEAILAKENPGRKIKNDPPLHKDDILGVQALYGRLSSGSSSSPSPPSSPRDDDGSGTDESEGSGNDDDFATTQSGHYDATGKPWGGPRGYGRVQQ